MCTQATGTIPVISPACIELVGLHETIKANYHEIQKIISKHTLSLSLSFATSGSSQTAAQKHKEVTHNHASVYSECPSSMTALNVLQPNMERYTSIW